jgi:hypothetical protein
MQYYHFKKNLYRFSLVAKTLIRYPGLLEVTHVLNMNTRTWEPGELHYETVDNSWIKWIQPCTFAL